MKKEFKIQLGSSGFFGQQNTDIFLDLSLYRTTKELKPEVYENIFDIKKYYDSERDECRSFFIYGIINSISDINFKNKNIEKTIVENNTKIDLLSKQNISINHIISDNNKKIASYNSQVIVKTQERDDLLRRAQEAEESPILSNRIFAIIFRTQAQEKQDEIDLLNTQIQPLESTNQGYISTINSNNIEIQNLIEQNDILRNSLGTYPEFFEIWNQRTPPNTIVENIEIINYTPKSEIILNDGSVLNYIQNIEVKPANYQTGNVFDNIIFEYSVFLENYYSVEQEVVYLFVNGTELTDIDSNFNTPHQLFKQQLIFKDENGNVIPYGSNTQDIRMDGTIIEVNNDFPYFYQTHWIQKDIQISRKLN